ncbi:response regulator [Arsenicicoccus piscis]|uniref:response regulator n=1 Tax=Arsenicicoccus piscis TaxID=673954 RepID=UPI0024E13A5E|nr:response regulator transcription factor [Arsenicicoccus piscis]
MSRTTEPSSAGAAPSGRGSAEQVRVLVADDHPMWRDAVARDLEDAGFDVVGIADDGPSAVRRTIATRPDVLVLDLNLPGLRGDEVCVALAEAALPTRVLILSASAEQQDVLEAVKSGASGYLVKSAAREEFIDAVHATAAGKAVFTPGLAGLVLGSSAASPPRPAPPRAIPRCSSRPARPRCCGWWRPACPTRRSRPSCSSPTALSRTTSSRR